MILIKVWSGQGHNLTSDNYLTCKQKN